MRKVILGAGITLDGCLARPDGSVDYLHMTKVGAKDFPIAAPTYVFSRTQPPGERDGVIFTRQSPAAWLRKIRARPGKHSFHMGGGELARSFLQADLIDELYLGIVPILLGRGIPFFPAGFPQRDFTLVENKTYSKSQISLTYRRIRSKRKLK